MSVYLDVLIAHTDVIRARHTVQYRNLEVEVWETHEGAQDRLSFHPRSLEEILKKENQTHGIINTRDKHINNPLQVKGAERIRWMRIWGSLQI